MLKEGLDVLDAATNPPLWGDPFAVDARTTRRARLLRKLVDGDIYRRDAELAGELASDVKLSSRPLTEISRMLLAWVLGLQFPTRNTEDLLTSIVGWMPVPPPRAVLSRFLKQGFRWHPISSDMDPSQSTTTRGGWGEFDPRKAPLVVTLAPSETRVHHEPIIVGTEGPCEHRGGVAMAHAAGIEVAAESLLIDEAGGGDSSSGEEPVE